MKIVIATLGLEFNGDTLKTEALGGSETAVICVARELAKLKNSVEVYCNCDKPGIYDGVEYKNIGNWSGWQFIDCDIFIASRFFDLGRVKINSKLNILWNHDTLESVDQLMSSMWNWDYLYCLSEFHKKNYIAKVPELEKIIKLNSNGIDMELVQRLPKKHKIMFTSRPERGLMDALKIYETIGDKSLEFLACNYKSFDIKETNEIEEACIQKMQELGKNGFNIKMGRFTKPELYKEISESKAVIYPTSFPEIFCISAIEAQANGTAFLTTDDFALRETVGYKGIGKENYSKNFLEYVKQVLHDPDFRKSLEKKGIEHTKKYTWENVAKKFIDDAMAYFKERSKDVIGIIEKLDYESDLVAARILAKNYHLIDKVKYFDNQLRFVDNPELLKEIYEAEETHEQIELSEQDLEQNSRFIWLADMVRKHKVGTLLDYACHMGLSSIITSNRNPGLKITGYDISERALDKGRKRLKTYAKHPENVSFVNDQYELKQFDALFCGEYLEHVIDPELEIKRLEGFVKDGGKMFFTVPRGPWEWISREQNIKKDVVYHVNHIDYQDIQDMFGHRKDFELLSLVSGYGPSNEMVGQYLIQYTKDDQGVGKRNFERKFLVTRPYQSISACIIAKDASKDIEVCLDSFYKDVDEVIIAYDPASKDADDFKARVKKYYNVKVFDMPKAISTPDMWGFSNARNFTIEQASSKWILWVDSDERFVKWEPFRKYLDTPLLNGFTIKQHHAQMDSFTEADRPTRLFRKGIAKFSGYIHEQPQMINDINAPIEPALIMDSANIVNFGMIHEAMRREKALARNLPLLKIDVAENVDKRLKQGLPIRKLSMILVMRDFVNRMNWGYEKYKTFQTKDVMELCIPNIKSIYNKYFRDEKDILYKEMADQILQKAYDLANIGVPTEFAVGNKKVKMRVDLDDFDSVKNLFSEILDNAGKIS